MPKHLFSNVQWYVLLVVIGVYAGVYRVIENRFGGWWGLLVWSGMYVAVLLVLRVRSETNEEARARRRLAAQQRASRAFWRASRSLAKNDATPFSVPKDERR